MNILGNFNKGRALFIFALVHYSRVWVRLSAFDRITTFSRRNQGFVASLLIPTGKPLTPTQ